MDKMERYFDDMYGKTKGRRFSEEPRPNVRLIPSAQKRRKGLIALEIGAGEGQNLIYLSKHGYVCTATDISSQALIRARKYAAEKGIKLATAKLDIRRESISGRYDCIIMALVLHNLQTEERYGAIKKIMKATRKNGINFISFYTERNGKKEMNLEPKLSFLGKDLEGSITKIYRQKGWKIIELRRYNSIMKNKEPCKITTVIARKIGS